MPIRPGLAHSPWRSVTFFAVGACQIIFAVWCWSNVSGYCDRRHWADRPAPGLQLVPFSDLSEMTGPSRWLRFQLGCCLWVSLIPAKYPCRLLTIISPPPFFYLFVASSLFSVDVYEDNGRNSLEFITTRGHANHWNYASFFCLFPTISYGLIPCQISWV